MARLRAIGQHTGSKFKAYELNICYPVAWGKEGIEASLASLCAEAVDAVKSGHNILIVSDRRLSPDLVAIPALLATSSVHQHLVAKGLRASTGLMLRRRRGPPLSGPGNVGRTGPGIAARDVA